MTTEKRHGVARPADPAQAIARRNAALQANDLAALANIVNELPHKLVGYWGGPDNQEAIVNAAGETIGKLQPGDSIIGLA